MKRVLVLSFIVMLLIPSLAFADNVIIQGINAIVGFCQSVVGILYTLAAWCFDAFMWICIQTFLTLTMGIFSVILIIFGTLDLGALGINAAASWGYLDSNVAGGLVATGVPTGMSIIGNCILVRMLVNLIPGALTRI